MILLHEIQSRASGMIKRRATVPASIVMRREEPSIPTSIPIPTSIVANSRRISAPCSAVHPQPDHLSPAKDLDRSTVVSGTTACVMTLATQGRETGPLGRSRREMDIEIEKIRLDESDRDRCEKSQRGGALSPSLPVASQGPNKYGYARRNTAGPALPSQQGQERKACAGSSRRNSTGPALASQGTRKCGLARKDSSGTEPVVDGELIQRTLESIGHAKARSEEIKRAEARMEQRRRDDAKFEQIWRAEARSEQVKRAKARSDKTEQSKAGSEPIKPSKAGSKPIKLSKAGDVPIKPSKARSDQQVQDAGKEKTDTSELAKLRLESANQRASIDALSSKLRSAELALAAAKRQVRKSEKSNARIRELEEENRTLADQLHKRETAAIINALQTADESHGRMRDLERENRRLSARSDDRTPRAPPQQGLLGGIRVGKARRRPASRQRCWRSATVGAVGASERDGSGTRPACPPQRRHVTESALKDGSRAGIAPSRPPPRRFAKSAAMSSVDPRGINKFGYY